MPQLAQTRFPPGYFPREFRDVTPRELLTEVLRHTTNAHRHVVIDPEQQTASYEPGLHIRLWRKLKSLFQQP